MTNRAVRTFIRANNADFMERMQRGYKLFLEEHPDVEMTFDAYSMYIEDWLTGYKEKKDAPRDSTGGASWD